MRKFFTLIALLATTFNVWGQTSEYCGDIATPTVDHGCCHPIIDWTTADNGDVVITISASEGVDGETHFRNAKGMNGKFTLSEGTIEDYFVLPTQKTDDYTITLKIKDSAVRPAEGVKINYAGQIECRSSVNTDDWSDYAFSYTYGAKCSYDAAVTGVTLNMSSIETPLNKPITLQATVEPILAGNKAVTWSSTNESVATVVDGIVTPVALGNTTITVTTVDGGFKATCEVTVTAAKLIAPDNTPEEPTHDAANVLAIYSPKYNTSCNHGAWGGSESFQIQDAGIKIVMNNNGYVGLVDFPARDCSTMQKFHADVWVEDNARMRFVPITGAGEYGVFKDLVGGQWNSIEIALDEGDWANTTNWTNVFQIKIDNAPNLTFWINNVYFYREPTGDVEAPTNVSAEATASSLSSVTIKAQAEDNSGKVLYVVMNGEQTVGNGTANSGEATDIVISGLNIGTEYTFTVVAKDAEGNEAQGINVTAQTNNLTAAPAPATRNASDVRKIYSDAYDNVLAHDFSKNTWSGIQYSEAEAEGNHMLVYNTSNTRWVALGDANDGDNAIIAADGYNDGTNRGLDVSEMEYLHVDIYSTTAIPGGPISTINDDRLALFSHDGNGWQSYDFPLSELATDKLNNVRWMKFEGMNNTDEFVIDNVYFYKEASVEYADYYITGDYNGWNASATDCIQFVKTETEGILQATAEEFKTGQWGFKILNGEGWDSQWGCENPVTLGEGSTLENASEGKNIYVGEKNNKLILFNAVFTLDITNADAPVLTVTCDKSAVEATAYTLAGAITGWSLDNSLKFEYNADNNNYTLSVDKFEGEFKILKENKWGTDNEIGGSKEMTVGEYQLIIPAQGNAGVKLGTHINNAVLTLTFTENGATLKIEGTPAEEHSFGLVGAFQNWSTDNATFFEEQTDGTWTVDVKDFPGASGFKVSIDKSWTCYLAQNGVTTLTNGEPYTCAKADNDNNFMIGEEGKTYDVHFVLSIANDVATLTASWDEPQPESATYWNTPISHFNDKNADPNSFVLLSAFNNGNGTMTIRIANDPEKNTHKDFDYLQVTGYPTVGTDSDTEGQEMLQVVIPIDESKVTDGKLTLEILWSYAGWGGRWMVQNLPVEVESYQYHEVTIDPSVLYGTVYFNEDLLVAEGNTVYTATVNDEDGTVKFTQVTDEIIPALTPVIVGGNSAQFAVTNAEAYASPAKGKAGAFANNDLVGTLEAIDATDKFVIGIDGEKVGFYPTTSNVAACTAYIARTATSPADGYKLSDSSTAISSVATSENSSAIYNIAGQRLSTATKGLYIQNGKKFVVK